MTFWAEKALIIPSELFVEKAFIFWPRAFFTQRIILNFDKQDYQEIALGKILDTDKIELDFYTKLKYRILSEILVYTY